MKTMFTAGFAPQHSLFAFRPYMGQTVPTISISQNDRDKFFADLNRAAEEYKTIAAWRASNGNWQTMLGSDLVKFNSDMSGADAISGNALSVQQKISVPAPTYPITDQEWTDANQWIIFIDDAFRLMKAHGAAPQAAITAPAAPISPLAIGVGAAAAVGLIAVLLS